MKPGTGPRGANVLLAAPLCCHVVGCLGHGGILPGLRTFLDSPGGRDLQHWHAKERNVVDVAREICKLFNREPETTVKHVQGRAFNDRRYFM